MKRLTAIAVALLMLAPTAHAQTVNKAITFENTTRQCINIDKSDVTIWITSIRLEKRDNFLSSTKSAGAQVNVTLAAADKEARTFPVAQEINVRGQDGPDLSIGILLPLLTQRQFDTDAKLIRIDAPLTFLKTKGDTAFARYAKAIVKFGKTASGLVPANPYAPGVELVGKLADNFFEAFKGGDSETVQADLKISHALSHSDSCNELQLHDGVQARISDPISKKIPNTIAADTVADYCFYAIGTEDPSIGYIKRPSEGCSKTIPQSVQTLRNPQMIYLVYGSGSKPAKLFSGKLKKDAIAAFTQADSVTDLPKNLTGDRQMKRALTICAEGGIPPAVCVGAVPPPEPKIEQE